jgi:hypothetical protein
MNNTKNIRLTISNESFDFHEKIKSEYGMSWGDVLASGIKYLMAEHEEISNAIYLSCYEDGYLTKYNKKFTHIKPKNLHDKVYIFWMSRSLGDKLNIYYKFDLNDPIKIIRMSMKNVSRDIAMRFPLGSSSIIPE